MADAPSTTVAAPPSMRPLTYHLHNLEPVTDAPTVEKPADTQTEEVDVEEEGEEEEQLEDAPFIIKIVLPHEDKTFELPVCFQVSPLEQIHEIRQSIIEHPIAVQYSCFHLEHNGQRINDFIQVSDVEGLANNSDLHVVEDPYTEKEARIHFIRIRELIGAAGDRTDTVQGILSGVSVFDDVVAEADKQAGAEVPVREYNFEAAVSPSILLPKEHDPAPKTVKLITLSSWNPPPAPLRQKGHLLYLTITTNEGEQFQVTSHVGGFYVNNSSNNKFDPSPKQDKKAGVVSAHSLYTLLEKLSPSFAESFEAFQKFANRKDPLATFQIGNTVPSAPWLVPSTSSPLVAHIADPTRSQETFLLGGAENTDSLRDWNEEFQSARELPKDTIQDRVFRERLIAKLHADYNDAAARGAVLVARGEVAPLNPTEGRDAQIFVYNNVFFSFGADGVGTFTSEGGDEAAKVATGKDVFGVKLVNQLDIDGLYTPGTVVVDYLGKRIVGQSIVPGIFKQPEPGENQIHYGAVDGKDVVAADQAFAPGFEKLAGYLRVKKHAVWDKENKRHDLEASVEMKGLLGTDGRKYVLDLYRITPLDIQWMEEASPEGAEYPHRMTVLRPELVESLGKQKARDYVSAELRKRAAKKDEGSKKEAKEETKEETKEESKEEAKEEIKEETKEEAKDEEKKEEEAKEEGAEKTEEKKEEEEKTDRIDMSDFKFALNPDVFSGQVPQTDEEKEEMAKDEQDVRDACKYLTETVIPGLLRELRESEISFPMDGRSLSALLHRRGINMRYLGKLVQRSAKEEEPDKEKVDIDRLKCFREVCIREMIARSFKHVASKYLKSLPLSLTSACFAHLYNCFLGFGLNPKPQAEIDEAYRALFSDADLAFEKVTPESLREEVQHEVARRFRYTLADNWHTGVKPMQLLRETAVKLGLQLQASKFHFTQAEADAAAAPAPAPAPAQTNGQAAAESTGSKKKKNKKARDASPSSVVSTTVPHTFSPDDFVNVVPLIKDSCPRSALAEEALEAGRLSIYQGQKKIGEDLLLESLSLHEQIYGLVHPEVAQMYHTLSQLYFNLDQKDAAVELARKAVIVSERTLGIDSAETVLNYLNLSLFLHQRGDSKIALVYARHALDVWKLIYGHDHPDTITTINNYAVMLQSIRAYTESRRWFEESLRVCDQVYGKNSINSATLLFQLAQALALDQDAKAAVDRMKESYTIFKALLGAEDKNTKEAEHWLEQLTHNAVSIAKQAKDLAAKRARAGYKFASSGISVGSVTGAPAQLPGRGAAPGTKDGRNIDELMRYIEGGEKKGKGGGSGGKKRPGKANPKRRGGASGTA
ncbi:clustered mitochondria-domain-containing protein [Cercophora samala]|uniref:Clustered mitochondria protein homolog n=1 Tax=Cercophora samala TaxID=330535 RepID=A0AA39ZMB0_9PEZI|nr:clustered mitochondria-domain-containing protein [Cercophora samala]